MPKTAAKSKLYTCKYCNKGFKRENSLVVHTCEQKKCYNEYNEKGVRIGFNTYIKFYKYSQESSKVKTFDDFVKSPYYKAFVRFGRYSVNINAVAVDKFADFVVRSGKKLDYWASDKVYDEFLMQHLKTENPMDALARALEHSIKWGEENNANDCDILRFGNVNANCYAISNGRISAWVLYNCVSGQAFLSQLGEEQIKIVWPYIDTDYWQQRFNKYSEEQEYISKALKDIGW